MPLCLPVLVLYRVCMVVVVVCVEPEDGVSTLPVSPHPTAPNTAKVTGAQEITPDWSRERWHLNTGPSFWVFSKHSLSLSHLPSPVTFL